MHEMLLLVSCSPVADGVLLTSIWATTGDLVLGHRRTDLETLDSAPKLLARLGELAPVLFQPSEASEPETGKETLPVSALAVAA